VRSKLNFSPFYTVLLENKKSNKLLCSRLKICFKGAPVSTVVYTCSGRFVDGVWVMDVSATRILMFDPPHPPQFLSAPVGGYKLQVHDHLTSRLRVLVCR